MKKSQFNYVALCVSALLLVASCEQPHEHSWSQEYSHDTAEHWKTCSGCEEVSEKEAHSYGDWKEVVAATETAVGSKERSCTVCGYKETAEIPVLGHTHVWSETYSSDANHHWKTCSGCAELGSDGSHTYGDWTETVAATEQTKGSKERACTVCGYKETAEIPELEHTHVWSETYSSDDTHHWKTCSGCTELDSKAEHTYDEGVETTPATYTEKGVKTFTCSVCGKTYTDDIDYIPVPKATADKVIYDLTDKTSSDLMDDFVITKYGNNGWEAASATAKVVQDYKGNPAISFDAWSNYTVFKYSYDFGGDEKAYGNIDFVAKGDDVITLKIQLMSSEHGVYATYDLGKLSSDYKEYSIFLKDNNWKVTYGGQTVTLDQLIQSEVLPMNDGTEMINMLAFDQINFIFYGEKSNYGNSSVVLNNLKFKADGNVSYAHEIFYNIQDSFVVESEDGKYITLDIDYEAKTAKFKPDASQATEILFTVSGNPEDGLLHFESEAAQVQLDAKLQKAGTELKVLQVAGNGAAAFEPFVNGVLVHGANTLLDFSSSSLVVGNNFKSAEWTNRIYGNSGWGAWKTGEQLSDMRVKETTDHNKNVNMYVDWQGRQYAYICEDPDGISRYFSVKVGNWWTSGNKCKLKVVLVTTTGEQIYVYGDANGGAEFAWTNGTTSYTTLTKDLGEGKKIAQVIFTTNQLDSKDTYLYIDDLTLSYQVPKADPTPAVLDPLNLSVDFESFTTLPNFITYAPSNVYFKNVSGAGQNGSAKYLSIYSKGGNLATFTLPTAGTANYVSFYTKNDFNGAVQTTVQVKVFDTKGAQVGETLQYDMAAGEAWTKHEVTLPDDSEVAKITFGVVATGATADSYAYLDSIVITNKLPALNLSLDFESYTSLPNFITYTPSNVYFKKDTGGKGQNGSDKFLSIYSKGGNLVTFTLPQVGTANSISFYTKNDFNGAVATGVEVKVYDSKGTQVGETLQYQMAAGEAWAQHSITLPADSEVAKITFGVLASGATSDSYAYLDTVVIG